MKNREYDDNKAPTSSPISNSDTWDLHQCECCKISARVLVHVLWLKTVTVNVIVVHYLIINHGLG